MDSLIILLNLSASYSILPYLLFHQFHRFINALIIIVIDLIYLLCRVRHFPRLRKERLFGVYLLISVVNLVSAILTRTGWQYCLAYLALNTAFYLLLCGIFREYRREYDLSRSLRILTRGYIWLVAVALFSCISLFLLIKMGVNPLRNEVNLEYDLFKSNYEELGANYFFPFHLAILNNTTVLRIPFFQDYGIISGIYHEPHIVTFMTFPALFLLLYYARSMKQRLFVVCCFLLIMLLAGSTTNIFATLGCLLIYMLYTSKASFSRTVVVFGAFALVVVFVLKVVGLSAFQFIGEKIGSSSMGYSQVTITYAFTPRTLLGTSFYNESEVTSMGNSASMDVGYIKFFLNLIYLGTCYYYLFRLFRSKRRMDLAFLLFAAYFFLHSAKVSMVSYSLTMLTFITFIMTRLYWALGPARWPVTGRKRKRSIPLRQCRAC